MPHRQAQSEIQASGSQFELKLNLSLNLGESVLEPAAGTAGQAVRILAAVQAKFTSQNAETSFSQSHNISHKSSSSSTTSITSSNSNSNNNKKTNFPFYV